MTQDEIISQNEVLEMAREAGIDEWWDSGNEQREVLQEHLEAFAKLVDAKATAKAVEREREACAKHLESMSNASDMKAYANSIRARGGEAK